MSEIKDRIGAIDAFGRELAATVNERIEAEGLVGQSPATIRRVEELIAETTSTTGDRLVDAAGSDSLTIGARSFEFHVIGKGITAKPFVAPARYLGKVAP